MRAPEPPATLATEILEAVPGRHGRVPRSGVGPARFGVHRFFGLVEGGQLTVIEGSNARTFGRGRPDPYGRDDLRATLTVHDPRLFTALARRGSSGLGEAYRRGWFSADDLTSTLRLLARALRRTDGLRRRLRGAAAPVTDSVRRLRSADSGRDRANVTAHYDLGNDFFALMLDPTMSYSSGRFPQPTASLEAASAAKTDALLRALDLRPGQRLLEIGTGWGHLAVHAASTYDVEVVTTTLSVEQHREATRRVAEAGLTDRVEVRLDHYRDLHGPFDALVAVEMIEAVDWRELPDFLSRCAGLVRPDGAVGLQAIVTSPQRQPMARTATDFIKTHIFPGGSIPSVGSIIDAAARSSDLFPVHLDDFGLHYAETLRRWRASLAAQRKDALALGLDEAFLRLWEFYLCYCEAGFEERLNSVVHLVLERPGRSASLLDLQG